MTTMKAVLPDACGVEYELTFGLFSEGAVEQQHTSFKFPAISSRPSIFVKTT